MDKAEDKPFTWEDLRTRDFALDRKQKIQQQRLDDLLVAQKRVCEYARKHGLPCPRFIGMPGGRSWQEVMP